MKEKKTAAFYIVNAAILILLAVIPITYAVLRTAGVIDTKYLIILLSSGLIGGLTVVYCATGRKFGWGRRIFITKRHSFKTKTFENVTIGPDLTRIAEVVGGLLIVIGCAAGIVNWFVIFL